MWIPVSAITLSFVLIVCRDALSGIKTPFGWRLNTVLFGPTERFLSPSPSCDGRVFLWA